jgi:hypothetical protein
MSNSSKPDTNPESVSYLIMFSYSHGGSILEDLDKDSYLFANSIEEVMPLVHAHWDHDIEFKDIRVLPFYPSQIKSIKQTLELV